MSVPAFSPYQRFVVALLALLQFTVVLDFMVLSPLSDVLMKSMDISTKQFGWVVSAYAFSAGISGILAAGFADKFDRKKLLLFFYIGFIGGTAFCAMSNNYVMLLSARIVTGLFGGVIGAISMAIIADLFAVQQRGRVMGIVQMGFAVSQVLGIPAGLFFANNWGWHSSFWMIVILAILIAISIIWLLKPVTAHLSIQHDKSPFLHFWHTLQSRRYRTGFAATALLSVGGFMMMPFASVFLVNNIHIHHDDLPIIFLCTGIASIVIMPVVGRLSDKVNKFSLFVAGSALAMAMVLVYTNLVPVPLWAIILLNMVMFVGIMSRMVPAMSLVTSIPTMSDRGAFMSINSSLQQMAGGIAAIVAGSIVVQPAKEAALLHYPILGLVVVGAMLVCAIFVYRVSKLATDPAS
ncbi:MFS transporter [Terrimonas ferruginea]|uniref:MFS transporter n=1 Tax=Terrimonas ferruginea TaxID=249 RepID=UPI0004061514|nr:MFS transporter [Terrimonas ferruginea]